MNYPKAYMHTVDNFDSFDGLPEDPREWDRQGYQYYQDVLLATYLQGLGFVEREDFMRRISISINKKFWVKRAFESPGIERWVSLFKNDNELANECWSIAEDDLVKICMRCAGGETLQEGRPAVLFEVNL